MLLLAARCLNTTQRKQCCWLVATLDWSRFDTQCPAATMQCGNASRIDETLCLSVSASDSSPSSEPPKSCVLEQAGKKDRASHSWASTPKNIIPAKKPNQTHANFTGFTINALPLAFPHASETPAPKEQAKQGQCRHGLGTATWHTEMSRRRPTQHDATAHALAACITTTIEASPSASG
ncbi:hypothetical protein M409DRAFT_52935 [Zasmidium cellare ATCC 36951]|uniref:Uncharacterized protein n=1 Tax=Zasmidium cellare ATCC 36951 TaxID=1080233 RepID=A0A6A6CPG8_ZASCE|nr:uncharacterized protein M409DRAFT_52935 [Zasmidium cellare ATCC 36951]KAF2168951.1 hypothetical protein M409DRAFT_52935 [Zasmidium cellare ATCC 36951]